MILLRESAIGALDLAVRGIAWDGEDLVVVFCLGAAEEGMRFLELLEERLGVGVSLLGVFEGLDGFFEEVLRELNGGFGEEGWEGVGVEG